MSIPTGTSDSELSSATKAHPTVRPFNLSISEAAQGRLAKSRPSKTERMLRAKTKREAEQAEARALGIDIVDKIRVDRTWSSEEDAVINALYPDRVGMKAKLPHRSTDSINQRICRLGICPGYRNAWSASDLTKLKKHYAKSDQATLLAMFPGRTAKQIGHRANISGLRKPKSYAPTGNKLLDSIRQRCLELNYTMGDLDAMACTGSYFRESRWHTHGGHSQVKMTLAIKALGGRPSVEWDPLT